MPPQIRKISDYIWELPKSFNSAMKVPARFIATKPLLEAMENDVFIQISNVASLPGIVGFAYCMPDGHVGYGSPIGAVAAFDIQEGIISPGIVGFDISCGMRLVTTNLTINDVNPKIRHLVDNLFSLVPAGVGSRGALKLTPQEFKEVMIKGASWCLEKGFGWSEDLDHIEENGKIKGANPDKVSDKAIERGISQLGTLGSGNHYLEIQRVAEIFDKEKATTYGLFAKDQIVVMVHCGSRGFGHQVATDYLRRFDSIMPKYKIAVSDRQLACAPFQSPEGQDYYAAMSAAANTAFANRELITHQIRKVFEKVFGNSAESLEMHLIYDVAHNIAKVEEHEVDGEKKTVVIHRKGATRSFPNQPVIIGGSMETGSYLLMGTDQALKLTFGSTAHGSGRTMSRTKAKGQIRGENLQKEMEQRGIYVHSVSFSGLAEEAGIAYKNIAEVVESVDKAGISKKVASFVPLGNIKG